MTTNSMSKQGIVRRSRPWLHGWQGYVLKRVIAFIITSFAAITLAFFLFRALPGDPLSTMIGQISLREGSTTSEDVLKVSEYYKQLFGYDKPLALQYLYFLRNSFNGLNLGPSMSEFPKPARNVVLRGLPWTVGLVSTSVILAWFLGTAWGTLMGWFRRHRLASIAAALSTLVQVTPVYFVGIGLIILLAYNLGWLPAQHSYEPELLPAWNVEFISSVIRHAVLPMLSMVLVWTASWGMGMRQLIISVMGEDFLLYSEVKGLAPGIILRDYAFRNALLPQLAGLAIALGSTLNGAYIIEYIFQYPGLGYTFIIAIGNRDYNVLEGIIILSILGVLAASLIVDLCLPLIDPRIRVSE
jgi:peptide/nickel transport system permease protein